MPRDHVVKVGDDWVDGMLVGRAAALAEWSIRKEIDDPEFKQLCERLRWRNYAKKKWARLSPEEKRKINAYREEWRRQHPERCREISREAQRRRRQDKKKRDKDNAARRAEFQRKTQIRRSETVYICAECGAQWCQLGRIPSRPPKYCSRVCRLLVRARRREEKRRSRARP